MKIIIFLAVIFGLGGARACDISVGSPETLVDKVIYMPPQKNLDGYVYLSFNNKRQPPRFELYKASDCKSVSSGEVSASTIYKVLDAKKYSKHAVSAPQGEAISSDFSYVVQIRDMRSVGVFGGLSISVQADANKDYDVVQDLLDVFAFRKDYYPGLGARLESVANKVSLNNGHLRSAILRSINDKDAGGGRASRLVVAVPGLIDSISKVSSDVANDLKKSFAKDGDLSRVAPNFYSKLVDHKRLLTYRSELAAANSDSMVADAIKRYLSQGYDPEGLVGVAENRIKPYLHRLYVDEFRGASGSEDLLRGFISTHRRKDYDGLVPRAEGMIADLVKKRKLQEREEWVAVYRREFSAARTVNDWENFVNKYKADDPDKRLATAKVKLSQAWAREYVDDFAAIYTTADCDNFIKKFENYDPQRLIPQVRRMWKEAHERESINADNARRERDSAINSCLAQAGYCRDACDGRGSCMAACDNPCYHN
ncbi:hypothetical protein [Vitreoscilla filiformis]|nr:hypothetical protein [Vitreoscilla filiformis]